MRNHAIRQSHSVIRNAAFSLIELVVSLSIMSIVMLSITSAVMLASHALPDPDDPSVTIPATARLLSEITDELHFALHISDRSENAITFTVPDRDAVGAPGHGNPETIRYEWTGDAQTPGQLIRTYNFGAPVTVADNVHAFELTYATRPIDDPPDTYPGPIIEESTPTRLAWQHSLSQSAVVTGSEWYGQYLAPEAINLHPDAVSWRPSAAKIVAKGDGGILGLLLDSIKLRVEISHADPYSRAPTGGSPLASNSVNEASLLASAFNWWTFAFVDAPQVTRDQPTTIVVRGLGYGIGGYLRYDSNNSASGLTVTTNSGSYWQRRDNDAMPYELWGYQSIRHPDQHLTRRYVTGIGIRMQIGGDVDRRQDTQIETINTPEVLRHFWEADFRADPATLDVNGDGERDWNAGEDAGLYVAAAHPVINFVEPTTAYVCFRAGASGVASFRLDADWGADQRGASLYAVLDQSGGSQTLTLYQYFNASGTSKKQLHRVSDLSTGFVDLMLLVDPTQDTVNIRVNGEPRGETYRYERPYMPGYDHCAGLAMAGPDAAFEFVSIRVGGTP